jgi:hypothetical protein
MQAHAVVCKCVCVYLCCIKTPNSLYRHMLFILRLSLLLTPGIARQSHWSNLDRGPKRLRNTGIQPWRRNSKCIQRYLCPVFQTIPSGNEVPSGSFITDCLFFLGLCSYVIFSSFTLRWSIIATFLKSNGEIHSLYEREVQVVRNCVRRTEYLVDPTYRRHTF